MFIVGSFKRQRSCHEIIIKIKKVDQMIDRKQRD